MFLLPKKIKSISILLVVVIIFTPLLYPINSAHAIVPVEDIGMLTYITSVFSGITPSVFNGEVLTEDTNPFSLKNLGLVIIKRFLRQLTQSIVDWIDSGFEGNPSFITNTGQFLLDTADITVGDFLLRDPALNFLCDPFKIQIKLALGLQYRPFKEQIRCSFTGALGNVNDAMNNFVNGDFIGGGGWNSWLQITTVPQNNQMGAMMLAQAELDARIVGNTTNVLHEANWGGGFMSWKDCNLETNEVAETDAPVYDEEIQAMSRDRYAEITGQRRDESGCVIKTPGGVIANKINWVDTSTLRELELANDFNAIINAVADQLITMGLSSISESGLLGSGKPKAPTAYSDYMTYLKQQETLLNNQKNLGNTATGNTTNTNSATNNSVSYNTSGAINFSQPFANKAVALDSINSQIATENQYLATQNNIYNLLDATQNTFTSSVCSTSIINEATNQITGNYTGVKDLSWNKIDVVLASTSASNNLSTLNIVSSSVQNTTVDSAIPGIVQPLTTMNTLHSAASVVSYSTGGTAYENIKSWVATKINANRACLSNISTLGQWGIQ